MPVDMYAEEIIAYYEHPENKYKMNDASWSYSDFNPVCGDKITVYIKVDEDKIKKMSFEGDGCAISMAAASMLTEQVEGKDIDEIEKMGPADVIKMIKVDPGPVRLKCATLSLRALQKAVFLYKHKEQNGKPEKGNGA